ncbi:MAG TPA: polysaccharide deacetylase family protein [Verrucomicrobiae bacterium]|jgi:oligosaccharide reducing-end xylanase|nr:polysaccharide deacetylase family protein [Verrucomicrobiae bacterium]
MQRFSFARTIAPIALVLAGLSALGGAIPAPYEVATWQGFRPAAVSFTFDDSCPNQFTIALPMFNAKGLKMTLFSCTGVMFAGWPNLNKAAAQGHEIASHTVTHTSFGGLTGAQQLAEMTNSQNAINANVTGQKCVTLAYPNCVEGTDSLVAQHYIAARICSGQIVPKTPPNFMSISSYVCGAAGSIQTLPNFTNAANSAVAPNGWCVYLIHGIDNDGGYSPLPSATLQQCANFFSTNQDRFWVQTFGNVVRYIRERNAATVVEAAQAEDSITLAVSDGLDDAIYNYPITLRRPLPTNWTAAVASQNNAPIKAQTLRIQSTNYIMFDVVPDAGSVILSKVTAPLLSAPSLADAMRLNIRLDGQAGARYAISSSTNLVDWTPVQTNELVSASSTFSVEATNQPVFFRAQWTQ